MKTALHPHLKYSALASCALAATSLFASSDYGPAIWRPAYSGHWYTSGVGHRFHVCHDMEGYYLSSISFMQRSSTSASVHYCVNGLTDSSDNGAAPGEISQMVLEANYAWHARCWNTYSTGTEHEGFVSNPAWFTEALYKASAGITSHLANKFGFAKDRNHIVGHDEKKNAAWCTYAESHLGIDAHCNTHTDPGAYWNWSHYMDLINPPTPPPPSAANSTRDFGGDGKDDYVLYSPSANTWNVRFSSDASLHSFSFGQSTDIRRTGWQLSGDNDADAVLFRPSTGTWYVRFSEDAGIHDFQFGQNGDTPLLGDFSADGMQDYATFRASSGLWNVRFSDTGSLHSFTYGQNGDIPLVGRGLSGDDADDAVVFRPSNGTWYVRFSEDASSHSFQYGQSGDIPMLGDFSGDGKDDYALFRPSNGTWYVRFSDDGSLHSFAYGQAGDVPMVGNYSGDNLADAVVYRPSNNTMYVRFSEDGSSHSFQMGQSGDLLVP